MLVYFYSSDRNGNRKMRSRCFWYIIGNKIIKKKSNLQADQGQVLQVISVVGMHKAQHVQLLVQGLQVLWMLVLRHLSFMSL